MTIRRLLVTMPVAGMEEGKNKSMNSTTRFIAIFLALSMAWMLAGCASGARLQGTITEDGSLNVQPLAQRLADSFSDRNQRVNITIKGSSTAAGIEAVNAGIVDLGGASRELKPDEPKLIMHLLARDGIAIIVNPANTISSLTRVQIRDIFSGKTTNWKEVGGADQAIHIFSREENTSTRSVLEDALMGGDKISAGATILLNNGDQKQAIVQDPQAFGYNPFAASLDGTVKALAVEGVTASKDNAKNGTYPLIRPLYFLTKTPPTGLVKSFIDYCLGADGQEIVSTLGYVPVR